MTSTNVISSQSFGTGSNISTNGQPKFAPAATTLQTGTTAFVVRAKWTAGAGVEATGQKLKVYYTTSESGISAANAPTYLEQTARYIEMDSPEEISGVRIKDSTLEPVTGTDFYCWVDAPKLTLAATLTVTLIELP
jgi:hypothetical protein